MANVRFEDLPNTVGAIVEGEPFALGAADSELFARSTWLDKAYPSGDVPEFPEDIVEGFWILAMLDAVHRFATAADDDTMWGLNYGLDKVRFITPVHLGDILIPTFETLAVTPKDQGFKVLYHCTFRHEASGTPAMIADWWTFVLPRGTVERARRSSQ